MRHLISSLINSGSVTILTSFIMTLLNSSDPSVSVWTHNWLISWGIVFSYVYALAPIVHAQVQRRIP